MSPIWLLSFLVAIVGAFVMSLGVWSDDAGLVGVGALLGAVGVASLWLGGPS